MRVCIEKLIFEGATVNQFNIYCNKSEYHFF